MTAARRFADAGSLTPVMREVFGSDRRIAGVDRLLNGSKKGVYRATLDDATSTIVYVWNADEDYWDGLLPDGHDDPSNPFAHASGISFFEGATRRLEAVGARSPRVLLADRGRNLYPGDIAVAEDVRGGTLRGRAAGHGPHYEALRDPGLDPRRMRYYQYVMHLDLVGGPLRIAEGDSPDRQWMLDVADFHLRKALDYET
ncbi:hypothetical protein ACWEN6_30690 [Sphaerisporangium sp. NPDC004334]